MAVIEYAILTGFAVAALAARAKVTVVTSDPAPAASQWTAEVNVTASLAAELIREQFPELAARQVMMLATGWDNTAFDVDGRWLFRFPRREVAVPGVRREIMVLPRLAAALPLPIPDPRFVGQPAAAYPWPFFGTRLLPGRELAESGLPDAARVRAAVAVGQFLRALHDPVLVAVVRDAGLPVDPMRRASPQVRAARAAEVLGRLADQGTWTADSDVGCLLARAAPAAGAGPAADPGAEGAAGRSGLVVGHGDLHPRHLLVDSGGTATGVIDWGDLCLADPAADLSIAYSGFAGKARDELLSAYGRPVGRQQELAARTCAISMAASLAEYAAAEGRAALLHESLAGLRRAVAP